jgi:hypothetical protein
MEKIKRKKRTKTNKSKAPNTEREGKVPEAAKAVVGKRTLNAPNRVGSTEIRTLGTSSVWSILDYQAQTALDFTSWLCLRAQGQRRPGQGPRDLWLPRAEVIIAPIY